MSRAVTVIREEQRGPFTIQVFDFADTWLLDTPVPANWHGLVYRVLASDIELHDRQVPYHVAHLGAKLVREENDKARRAAVQERLL